MSDENTTQEANLSILGRKIFFLFPTNSIKNQVIEELIQNEYEVYISKDQARLLKVLKKYSDSIVFVNIDEKLPNMEWDRWIASVVNVNPNVKIGVFSSSTDEEYKQKILKGNRVACGFLSLKLDMTKTTSVILEMLNRMNVKGRRKYLRACTDRESNATINIPSGGDFLNGIIKDISVVGVSCVFKHDPGLAKNALLKDIQIKLQSMLLKVEAVIFGSREDCGDKIYVMLFTQKVDQDIRAKIRKYIQNNLQSKMDMEAV